MVHIKRIPVTPIVTALGRSSYTLIWVRVYALVVFLFTVSSFLTSLTHSSKVLFIRKLLLCVEQTENKKVYFFYRRCFIDIGLHVRKKPYISKMTFCTFLHVCKDIRQPVYIFFTYIKKNKYRVYWMKDHVFKLFTSLIKQLMVKERIHIFDFSAHYIQLFYWNKTMGLY